MVGRLSRPTKGEQGALAGRFTGGSVFVVAANRFDALVAVSTTPDGKEQEAHLAARETPYWAVLENTIAVKTDIGHKPCFHFSRNGGARHKAGPYVGISEPEFRRGKGGDGAVDNRAFGVVVVRRARQG